MKNHNQMSCPCESEPTLGSRLRDRFDSRTNTGHLLRGTGCAQKMKDAQLRNKLTIQQNSFKKSQLAGTRLGRRQARHRKFFEKEYGCGPVNYCTSIHQVDCKISPAHVLNTVQAVELPQLLARSKTVKNESIKIALPGPAVYPLRWAQVSSWRLRLSSCRLMGGNGLRSAAASSAFQAPDRQHICCRRTSTVAKHARVLLPDHQMCGALLRRRSADRKAHLGGTAGHSESSCASPSA